MEAKPLDLPPDFIDALKARLEDVVPDRPEGRCWIPVLKSRINGYVPMGFRGARTLVHRWMYLAYRGDPGPVLDHLVCNNRECCNPDHLAPSDHRRNILRGSAPTAANAGKTHCKRGHPFDETNTYLCTNKDGSTRRICRACNNELTLRRYHARKQ